MNFQAGHIYHVYNQGNNRQKIFFKRENYLYFLRKIRIYILPYADILAWCLMPNHFHIMIWVNSVVVPVGGGRAAAIVGVAPGGADNNDADNSSKLRTLNDSIGIMLRSYTSAINKQENRSGKLIREKTKAVCVSCLNVKIPRYYLIDGVTTSYNIPSEKQYPHVCFNYIHFNPVKAKLVKNMTDWEFSSAADYFGNRKGDLINRQKALYLGLIK